MNIYLKNVCTAVEDNTHTTYTNDSISKRTSKFVLILTIYNEKCKYLHDVQRS